MMMIDFDLIFFLDIMISILIKLSHLFLIWNFGIYAAPIIGNVCFDLLENRFCFFVI
jgi:hypothetical protein